MRLKKLLFAIAPAVVLLLLVFNMAAPADVGASAEAEVATDHITVIDDFEDGDVSDWGFFGGDNAGGGGSVATDRPYEGANYFSTGWGAGGPSNGFFGGTFKNFDDAAQPVPPADAQFSVWVYNQSDANSDGYTLEITIREDQDGDGWDGFGNANGDESFRLDTTFTSADYNDQWVQITAPLTDFTLVDGTGGDGVFDANLDEIVIVVSGVPNADNGTTVEVDFDQLAFVEETPPPALTIIDDFNDGDISDWGFFGGDAAGGGGSAADDRPYEGSHYFSTGWGAGGPSNGFFGGTFKNFDNAAQVTPPADAQFSVWVYNQSDANSDGYTLEITIREDQNGDGWDGFGNANGDESFRLDTTFTSADYNDQWVQITAPLTDFSLVDGTGGDGVFDANLDEIVIVVSGVPNADNGTTVEVDFDQFAFIEGMPPPPPNSVVIDDYEDGDVSDWTFFGGDNAGGGGGIATDRPHEGANYFSTGWGAGGASSGFFGGMFKNLPNDMQVTPPAVDPYFSVWVYNESVATADEYTLEITLREDLDGNGWTDGQEDSIRLDTTFLSADFNDQWVQISAPLSDFTNLSTGGNGVFDGALDEVVVVIAGVPNAVDGTTVEVDFDLFSFVSGNPVTAPAVAFESNNFSVVEGEMAQITATLNITSNETTTVTYATSDGTAVAGTHYTATAGTLTFNPGEQTQAFTVDTAGNDINDDDRTVILTLSDPGGAELGNPSSATLTITDDEVDLPSGKSVILQDYENHTIASGTDAFSNTIGYELFSDGTSTVAVTTTSSVPAPVPGSAVGNTVLQEDLVIGNNGFSGFIYKFGNEDLTEWQSRNWQNYTGISFWLYGNNSGGVIFLDILDNRNPGSETDDAGRWTVDIPDDFDGWRYFSFTWDEFRQKGVGNGAPTDGFNLDEIHGYAFGGFGSQPMDGSYYIDDIVLTQRVDMVDDFEMDSLPSGTDPDGNTVGYYGLADGGGVITFTLNDAPPVQVPEFPASNSVLEMDMALPENAFGVYVHAFTNDTTDEWVPVSWEAYEGICFWLYGNDTGGTLFVDVLDNRNPGSTSDDAERYSVDIPDDFDGWQFFQFTWDELSRKDVGNGAPNDGLNLVEVHGYAVGGFGSIDMGQNTYYLDEFAVWGDTGADRPLAAEFELTNYEVTEGETATMTVEINRVATVPVTVTYSTAESFAIPNRDFVPVSGEVVIPAGETSATFTVETIDENKDDGDKNLMVVLNSAENADLGFARQTTLNIMDDEPTDPQLVDDFEGFHSFQTEGDVTLTIEEIESGDANALPDQGMFEQVLSATYSTADGPATLMQTFSEPTDWSPYEGMTFWVYGTNSGETHTIELMDNQSATTANTPAADWELVWADEFDGEAGTQPNENDWGYELGDGSLNGIPGWGNDEFQYYTDDPANVSMDGQGNLAITLRELSADTDLVCYYGPCDYTSARILTKGKTEFEYGRLEARVRVPESQESGLWPAFWTLGSDIDEVNWPATGEIDIMEYVSRVPNEIFGTIHGPGYSGGQAYGNTVDLGEPVANDYHTYAVEWTEDEIRWYFDGQGIGQGNNYHNAVPGDVAPNTWAFNDDPFFMLLNMAIGGNFGGAISPDIVFPQTMLVDYVRVYQAPSTAERFEATFVDEFRGWQQVHIPFSEFTRSADQPAGAPDDGLGLTSVWGYGFHLSGSGTLHMDQVRVGSAPTPSMYHIYLPIVGR